MADLPRHLMYSRIGVNSTPSLRTGTASTMLWLPVFEDGIQLNPDTEVQDIPTEHKTKGVRYRTFTKRNAQSGSISTPMFAANAGTLLGAALTTTTSDLPQYHHVQSYWGDASNTGLTGTNSGIENLGVIFNGFSLNFDRQQPGPLSLEMDAFHNQYKPLTGDATPSWPPNNPYDTRNVFIDFDIDETGFTGDNVDVRSMSITYTNNLELDVFAASTTSSLNGTWTKVYAGIPELTVEAALVVSDSTYPFLSDALELKKAQIRVMGYNPSASGNTTTTDNESAGTSVVFTCVSTAGFAVNDVVLLEDVDNGRQCVGTLSAVDSATVTVDETDVTIDGSGATAANIFNTGWQLTIPELEITTHSRPVVQGNVRVVNVSMSANIEGTNAALMTHTAYDDDNT